MRRLARRLFTLCAAGSLLLFAGVSVLWVRSRSSMSMPSTTPTEVRPMVFRTSSLACLLLISLTGCFLGDRTLDREARIVQGLGPDQPLEFDIDTSQLPDGWILGRVVDDTGP